MTFTKITEYKTDNGITIRFQPVTGYPGFSHMVLIIHNGQLVAKDWLGSEYKVSEKHAGYYYEKHEAKINAKLAA